MTVPRFLRSAALVAAGLLAVGACSSPDPLPKIDQPEKLLRDSQVLLDGKHQGEVPRFQWPPSLAEIHPREVVVVNDQIVVTCEVATGVGARGYLLNPKNGAIDARFHAKPTDDAGIYRFEWQPNP